MSDLFRTRSYSTLRAHPTATFNLYRFCDVIEIRIWKVLSRWTGNEQAFGEKFLHTLKTREEWGEEEKRAFPLSVHAKYTRSTQLLRECT